MSAPPPPPPPPDEPTAPQPPPGGGHAVGDVLGDRYELSGVLGQGGMATVWRAHDPVLHRAVAIKIFSATAGTPDATARAAVEVRMLAGLNHPHLVAVHDAAGPAPGRFDHLVMELVDGQSLRQRLDAGALAPEAVVTLGVELASGLEYVHDRGIVHRDLKPANILLERTSRGDRAKIADFGVARLLEGVALTMAGTTVGTANYLSPEQATGSDVGPASDIYSLGLVLLECLTGVLAFPGHGVAAAAARLHRPPDVPSTLPAGWPDLLTAMTALDPTARPDAAEVGTRLRGFSSAAGAATAVLPRSAPTASLRASAPVGGTAVLPTQEKPRRRGLLVAIGLVAAAIIAIGLIVGLGGGSDDTGPVDTNPSTPATSATTPVVRSSVARSSVARSSSTVRRPSTPRPSTTTVTRSASNPAPAPPGQTKKQDPKPGKDKGGPPGKDKP